MNERQLLNSVYDIRTTCLSNRPNCKCTKLSVLSVKTRLNFHIIMLFKWFMSISLITLQLICFLSFKATEYC
jgi:hypothetical protein